METKLYKEFLNLFTYLSEAGSIISDSNAYNDELRLKMIGFMKNANEINQPNENLFDEIKEKLMLNTLDKEGYLVCILRDFKDISAYLDISADKEYCTSQDSPALKMGNIYYSNVHISIHRLLERYCHWIEPILDYSTATVPEKYVIRCFHAYDVFFRHLDTLCLNFKLDLADIQAQLKVQVFERDNADLICNGYSEETIKRIVNNKRDKNLTHDEPDHTELFKALNKYITGINAIGFTNIIKHHSLTLGTPKAMWIADKVDACYFADFLPMTYAKWNKCFYFEDGKLLHKKFKDKLQKGSPVLDILNQYLPT